MLLYAILPLFLFNTAFKWLFVNSVRGELNRKTHIRVETIYSFDAINVARIKQTNILLIRVINAMDEVVIVVEVVVVLDVAVHRQLNSLSNRQSSNEYCKYVAHSTKTHITHHTHTRTPNIKIRNQMNIY
jgi:hypothetical protein